MINRILTPSELLVGGGAAGQLPALLRRLGAQRPLFVVDPGVLKLGLVDPIITNVRESGIDLDIFSDVIEDPTDVTVQLAADRIKAGSHDSVVGIGGGSAIDTAKAAAIVASTGEAPQSLKVPRIVDLKVMPVVAIPTTAGTGSEVTRACVVTDTQVHEKMLILGTAALPAAAIVDFELTLSCPFRVTADTGLDALTHALEALVNRNGNPHAEALALSALKLIGANLELACTEPQNRQAREAMMLGATQAGMAVSNTSTALIHGMSRPIGAFFHVPHGLANAMLLPLVTEYSASAAPKEYAAAARALGFASAVESDDAALDLLIAGFRTLCSRLNVPTLRSYGIDKARFFSQLPEMARQALQSGTPQNNPRIPSQDEIVDLYNQAWQE
jgi:alcohol dehydrogenase class IV